MGDYIDIKWKIPKKITIVKHETRTEKCGNREVPLAYIVFDDTPLNSAYNWAWKDQNSNLEDISVDGDCEFNVKIVGAANNSCVGGKLSFWYCELYDDTGYIDVVVGINSDILFNLIKNHTFVNGRCQTKVVLIRHNQSLGVTTRDSEEYKEALKAENYVKELENNKTTKWEVGYCYKSKETEVLYAGDIYKPVTINYTYSNYTYTYIINKKKYHATISGYFLNEDHNQIDTEYKFLSPEYIYLKCIPKFPAKTKCNYDKVDEKLLEKSLKEYIKYIHKKAENSDSLNEFCIEYTLMSMDGIVTKSMIKNLKRLHEIKECYTGYYDKHVVKYDGKEYKFNSMRDAFSIYNKRIRII